MSDSASKQLTVVCLASYFKGADFMRECKRQGARVMLLTKEKWLGEDWPRESIDSLIALPNDAQPEHYLQTVISLARPQKVDRLVALEEFDVLTAALIREHLLLPGMNSTTARLFRDKLAMRAAAHALGVNVPEFVHALNYQEIGEYMERVPPPWVLKPRADVSAIGIKKLYEAEQVWRALDELDARERPQERSTYFLLERFVPGEVYHADSLVADGKVIFAGANRYGRPPMQVAHHGGVFISYTIKHNSREQRELLKMNRRLIKALGLKRGATHAEFIHGEDGRFYFLEIAARIGGAYIAEVLEAASGVNLWREWARLELTGDGQPYELPPLRQEYGGIALSLARQEEPDTSAYNDPEIVYRVKKRHHVGLIVRAPQQERVLELLEDYARRFDQDFCAVVPPLERAE